MKTLINKIPVVGSLARKLYGKLRAKGIKPRPFPGSSNYWKERYSGGANSGVGSYGKFAEFKAAVINEFVTKHALRSVIEFGCGDGNQLALAKYPIYHGFDISETVISKCHKLFAGDDSKHFRLVAEYNGETADVALSLDVIYHLIEDDVFANYMRTLFEAANRYVIIYSSDSDDNRGYEGTHIRHRKVTGWIHRKFPQWKLVEHIPNKYPYQGDYTQGSFADFFIYART